VLDVGCGRSSVLSELPPVKRSVGLEAHLPALEESRRKGLHHEYVQGDARTADFPDGAFDAVLMMDLIEHLDRDEGNALLDRAERIANAKVIVFTPNGFIPQEEYDDNPLQVHRSGWSVDDFHARGYAVYGLFGLKELRGERSVARRPHLVTKPLLSLSAPVVLRRPRHAFQLLAVRDAGGEAPAVS
jgi:methyltransferase family protein